MAETVQFIRRLKSTIGVWRDGKRNATRDSAVVSGTITDSSLCLLFCSVGGFFQLSCLQPTQPVSSFCRLISFSVEDGDSRNAEGGWRDNQEFGLANWRKSSVLVEWQKSA